jgi:ribose 5-phosphate isomerase A
LDTVGPMNEQKRAVGRLVVEQIKSGMVLGIGTGSTVDAALFELGERMKRESLSLSGVVTSIESALACERMGITVLSSHSVIEPDFGFDGADEVDATRTAIKGKGGAMLREKLVAAACKRFVLIVDQSKVVQRLGVNIPVPVEVIPDGYGVALRGLKRIGATRAELRMCTGGKHGPVITEGGNLIIDANFSEVDGNLEKRIKELTGVVESGIFSGLADEVLVAGGNRF